MTDQGHKEDDPLNADRREFLRKSVYAAYATPLITSLLVAEESAAASRCSYAASRSSCAGSAAAGRTGRYAYANAYADANAAGRSCWWPPGTLPW